ncbi:MAG: hypothetical protein HKN53_10880, partial [Maribacter sp.]|nr:hypothetical protein [Maribacter sp.]
MKNYFFFLIVILFTSSCASLQYKFYNPKVGNTSEYDSFVVLNNCEEGQDIITEAEQDMVIRTFSNQLKAKGVD